MTLTVRVSSVTGATTASRALTHEEMDANWDHVANYIPPGSGAAQISVHAALDDLKAWISTDTVASRFYRYDGTDAATFHGTTDPGTFIGYNLTGFGQIEDASKAALLIGMEADYNDGTTRHAEMHFNIAMAGGSFKRFLSADLQTTGANAGKLAETYLFSDLLVSFYTPALQSTAGQFVMTNLATVGVYISLVNSDTGGKDWRTYSTGSSETNGAGNFIIYNATNSRYGLICDKNGSVIPGNLAAIATNAADGFLYVPTCAGIPTGTPSSYTGKSAMVVDSTNNKAYVYSGGAWRILN